MARVNPFALYPPSFEEAVREIRAVGPSRSKAAAAPKAHQKRQPTTRKAKKAKAKKKRKKK
jgi:hypothetical protein